tara:strand:- start:5207 stop:6220 length:1014 start_codon:yes stop_codon:yes gene_type:complete
MSTLIVNKLKNSSGGAPTLTWPTADGTDGQAIKSDDNAGKLSFATPSLLGGTTKLTFPDSATSGDNLETDGAGNVSAVSFTNPMNTPDNAHQGERLLDRIVFSGASPDSSVSSFNLMIPSGYTTQEFNTIRSMRLRIRALRPNTNTNGWILRGKLIRGFSNNNNNYSSSGTTAYSFRWRYGDSNGTTGEYSNMNTSWNASHQGFDICDEGVYSTSGASAPFSGANGDLFTAADTGTISSNSYYLANNGWMDADVMIHCATQPSMYIRSRYMNGTNHASRYYEYYYAPMRSQGVWGGAYNTMSNGRHPGGIQITNSASGSFRTGFAELYGTFKDGVVS